MIRPILAVLLAAFVLEPLAAADKPFALRYYGLSYFQLETPSGKKIVFDPHAYADFGAPLVTADIITCSHRQRFKIAPEVVENYKAARVFQGLKEPNKRGATEWNVIDEKVGTIKVRSLATYHDAEDGRLRGKNAVFIVEAEGLTVCHLGNLGHELSAEQVKAIGPVDVLLVPVGGVYVLNGESAKKVADAIKPKRLIVPMHYGTPNFDELLTPEEFLDGLKGVKKTPATNEIVLPATGAETAPAIVMPGWKAK